jgi:hypothetical protein
MLAPFLLKWFDLIWVQFPPPHFLQLVAR